MSQIITDLSTGKPWLARKGMNNQFTLTFTNGGSAFVITSYTFVLNIRKMGNGSNVIQLTQGSGLTNGGATGILTVQLSSSNTALLRQASYYYELNYTISTQSYGLLHGTLTLVNEYNSEEVNSSITLPVSLAGTNINLSITLAGSGSSSVWGEITGTLSDQTDLQTSLNAKANTSSLGSAAFVNTSAFDASGAAAAAQAASQPVDTDLTAIAGLTPSDGDFIYRESGAWVNKTTTQVKTILGVSLMPYAADSPNTAVTGTTSQTAWVSIPLPAGTILAGDIIRIKVFVSKTGTAGTLTNRIVFNTTNDLLGSPIIVGMWNGGGISGVYSVKAFREIFVNTLTVQYMSNVLTTNAVTDDGSFTSAATLPGIDFTVDQYLMLTAQLGNSGDTGTLRGFTIEILR